MFVGNAKVRFHVTLVVVSVEDERRAEPEPGFSNKECETIHSRPPR